MILRLSHHFDAHKKYYEPLHCIFLAEVIVFVSFYQLEKTASKVYEKTVTEPIGKVSERVRKEFINTFEQYLEEKGLGD